MSRMAIFFRRRKFVINRKLQYGLLATAYVYIAFIVLVVGFSLFFPPILDMGKGEGSTDQAIQAARFLLFLHERFWPPLLLTLCAIGLHSIMMSHRIAGPLHRITQALREILQGRLPGHIVLRKGDYLGPEVDDLNNAIDVLKDNARGIRSAGRDLSQYVQENKALLTASGGTDTLKVVEGIAERLEILEGKIDGIRAVD